MPLYHHPWPEAQQLAPLLAQALPSSLTFYNHLVDPTNADLPSKVYATFPPDQLPSAATAEQAASQSWVLLAETASQVRVYVSTEARAAVVDEDEIKKGEAAFVSALVEWARDKIPQDGQGELSRFLLLHSRLAIMLTGWLMSFSVHIVI